MTFLALSGFMLFSALASASQRHINPRDTCLSSPLQRHVLGSRDSYTQAPLNHAQPSRTKPSPWKSAGDCVDVDVEYEDDTILTESYCVYTSHDFADGRGISLLTTSDRAEQMAQLPAFTEAGVHAGINSEPSPPYEERELPGRGRGLIANKTLYRGDRIFASTPILLLDEEAFMDLPTKDWHKLQRAAVNALPPAAKSKFWQLYGWPSENNEVSDRVSTNSFGVHVDDGEHFAVFPEIARLNHDCRPNAAYFMDPVTLTQYVHAATTIHPGTEITITYIDPLMSRRSRLRALSNSWNFNCSCSLCSMHPTLTNASDARLAQLVGLERETELSSDAAQTLISLYEQERLYSHIAEAYLTATLAACAEGNRWSTIHHAQLGIEMGMLHNGFGDESITKMVHLAKQPEKATCWEERISRTLENGTRTSRHESL